MLIAGSLTTNFPFDNFAPLNVSVFTTSGCSKVFISAMFLQVRISPLTDFAWTLPKSIVTSFFSFKSTFDKETYNVPSLAYEAVTDTIGKVRCSPSRPMRALT